MMLTCAAQHAEAEPPDALLHPPCSTTTAAAWRTAASNTSAASSRPSAASRAASALSSHPLPMATGPLLDTPASWDSIKSMSPTQRGCRQFSASASATMYVHGRVAKRGHARHVQQPMLHYAAGRSHTLAVELRIRSASAAAGSDSVSPSFSPALTAAEAVPAPVSASGVPGGGVADIRSFAAACESPRAAVPAACGMARAL